MSVKRVPRGPHELAANGWSRARTIEIRSMWAASLLWIAVLLSAGGDASAQGSVASDRRALEDLHQATNGDNWTNDSGWLSQDPPVGMVWRHCGYGRTRAVAESRWQWTQRQNPSQHRHTG